ncbi:Ribosomal protein S6 kinase delta-1 [Amphibalanus amphitrite]|uniref:Ribosomal protein S6 kinase delta-1 n=1 Tax=Amphibalanus amphitrite TaxID=1232801 RepID=A0A6A4UY07_AMPAM|nr:Ribosomal protein S6 kinase delta-1 [Amphibalanus amphitrite]
MCRWLGPSPPSAVCSVRFLRPENVLLTAERGAALTYFCRLRCAGARAPPAAERGRLYAAPELWTPGAAVTAAADWWSLGALLWELHGDGPLWTRHPAGLAAHTALRPPVSAGPAARSLLAALLRPDPRRRPDARHIRRHAFFAGLDWSRL